MADVELTELHDIKVVRQDGVRKPASGFPFLLMKAVQDADGDYDGPYECGCPPGCGCRNDDGDIAKAIETFVYKRDFSADERKKLASEGKALSDGSYPIENSEDLKNAAHLAASGHGNVAAAKRLIAKRAKELGVANPLDNDDAKKAADESTDLPDVRDADQAVPVSEGQAPEGVEKTSEPAEGSAGDTDVAKQIADAVAEVNKAAEERIGALEAELAVIKATPIPGGPMLTATASQRDTRAQSDLMAKAAYHDRLAKSVQDRELARYHREQAAKLRDQA